MYGKVGRYGKVAGLVFASALLMGPTAQAAQYTFAGFTFEQDGTPDVLDLLGNGATLGGATFSSGTVEDITRSVGFVTSDTDGPPFVPQAGFDPSLSLGQQAFDQHGVNGGNSDGCHHACAVNMPEGNNGTTDRHGLDTSWSGGRQLINEAGDDFVVYESASTPTGTEGFMVRVELTDGSFSGWRFEANDGFELYSNSSAGESGATSTGFDLTDFGLGLDAAIVAIQIANLVSADTIDVNGFVVFDGSGSAHGFGSSSLDPDPLYVGALSSVTNVPLPGAIPLFISGVAGLFYMRRRKRSNDAAAA